jgi:hypothetical protein
MKTDESKAALTVQLKKHLAGPGFALDVQFTMAMEVISRAFSFVNLSVLSGLSLWPLTFSNLAK